MYLFKEDYAHLSSDHFDANTNNVDFIRMFLLLKRMGIENNKFFLIVTQPELRGIDPHNLKDDSQELKLKIAYECKVNPWYFFREVIRIPVVGHDGIHFILNRANLSLIWLFFNHIDNLLVMPRQLGKTIGSISISTLITFVTGLNTTFSMLTKDDKLRKENVDRLRDIRDALPEWFVHKMASDTDRAEEISYSALKNKYNTFVAQGSISGAEKLGRGMTTPCQHWDEPAYFNKIEVTYPIAISSTNTAIENAQKFGQHYGNILTTTAGKLNTEEGKFTHSLICNSLVFNERLYDLPNETKLREMVMTNSKQGMVYSEFTFGQLGKTKEWFDAVAARTVGGEDIVNRDLLNIWTYGTEKSPIDKSFLERMYASKRDPEYIQFMDEFIINWYIPKEIVKTRAHFNDIPIVIGMDGSENVGKDFTSFVFVDARTMEVIGTCVCNTVNIIKVALFITKFLVQDNVLFIPERNSVGVAIIDMCLLELDKLGINPFLRIYNDVIQFKDDEKYNKINIHAPGIYDKYRKTFGFRTTSSASRGRSFLYKTVFFKALDIACHLINDIGLVNEIAGLGIKNGRIDHSSSGHDDRIIGYILTGFLLFFGNNLDRYDFCKNRTDDILKGIGKVSDDDISGTMTFDELEDIKDKITLLDKRLKMERNSTIRIDMMHSLKRYKSMIPEGSDNIIKDIPSLTQLRQKRQPKEENKYTNTVAVNSFLTAM